MSDDRSVLHAPAADVDGLIVLDEHRSVACFVTYIAPRILRITLIDADIVPNYFLLTFMNSGEFVICVAKWRKGDEIGCKITRPS